MRDRHRPRLCRSCDAPMARQEDTCWSREAAWDYRHATRFGRRSTGRDRRPLGAEGSRRIGGKIAAVH